MDGRKHWVKKPYLNQCEVDIEKRKLRWGYLPRCFKIKSDGHFVKYCSCFSNKRNSWYWRLKRK